MSLRKITLSEALLLHGGALTRMGRVEDDTTHSDHTDAEKCHGFSVATGVLRLRPAGTGVTLLDTPVCVDFVRGEPSAPPTRR